MKKNYLLLILFFLFSSSTFAQTDKPAEATPAAPSDTNVITPNTATSTEVTEKIPLPKNQKVAPAVFYVENDKPVDQMTYQRHVKQNASK